MEKVSGYLFVDETTIPVRLKPKTEGLTLKQIDTAVKAQMKTEGITHYLYLLKDGDKNA
jgi:hypothetical protein